MRQGAEVYQKLKSLTKKRYGQSAGNVGDEGGVAPDIQTAEEALSLITDAIEEAGYTGQIKIAMDVASSEFYKADEKSRQRNNHLPPRHSSSLVALSPIICSLHPLELDDWLGATSHSTLRSSLPRPFLYRLSLRAMLVRRSESLRRQIRYTSTLSTRQEHGQNEAFSQTIGFP
jgi:hypothetical protein